MVQRSGIYRRREVLAAVIYYPVPFIALLGGTIGPIIFIIYMVRNTDLRWWQIVLMVPLWWLGVGLACLPFMLLSVLVGPKRSVDDL